MLSRHVRRVVSRILAASNLGIIRGGDTPSSYITGITGAVGADEWDPDAEVGVEPQRQERQWDIMVVNDPKMVNAQAVPGDGSRFNL